MPDQSTQTSSGVNVPRWLTVPEFADATRMSAPTIYRHVHEGRIKHARVGGTIRIPREVLEAFERCEDVNMA